MNINIVQYNLSYKKIWDDFVSKSKNGTFLIKRDYVEYHSDRFEDHSLLFYSKTKLVAILPANIKNDENLISHEGLTYGGLVMSAYTKVTHVLAIFESLKQYMKANGIARLIYKKTPYIYCKYPSDEDLYALFKHNASRVGCAVSSAIYLLDKIPYSKLRQRCINKSKDFDLRIEKADDFSQFWTLLESNLSHKYNAKSTHSLDEMQYLYNKFNNNIILYQVLISRDILGGCICYISDRCVHVQYIASSVLGRKIGALDHLFDQLILLFYNRKLYFDFGTSIEKGGLYLNEDLIFQKEGFGARAITYDTYQLTVKENIE